MGAQPEPDRLELPTAIRDEIVARAREAGELECCGLVVGRQGAVTRTIMCRNVAPVQSVRYLIDPREQLAAFRSMDAQGEDLIAIYHSHPASEARPSSTDVAEASYPDAAYLLVSLRGGEAVMRAFRIASERSGEAKVVREIELVTA